MIFCKKNTRNDAWFKHKKKAALSRFLNYSPFAA